MFEINNLIFNLYPELLVLAALILAILMSTSTRFKNYIWIFSTIFLVVAAAYIFQNQIFLDKTNFLLSGSYINDNLSILFKLLVLIVTILIILGSVKYSEGFIHRSEFFILLLSATLGTMFLISSNDLITFFVSLETLGLSSIMLAGYSKYDERSNEASLKYLLNSASASAILLFGFSILYGLTGSTQFYEIKYTLTELYNSGELNLGILNTVIILIVGALAFKLASAPMHMWSPDVYEGAPTPTTAFLSVASKAAAVAVSIRVLYYLFSFMTSVWVPLIVFISILSMVLGNLVALSEVRNKSSIKRLMAYSSIAQVGYILIGLALATPETISASVFYMINYAIINTAAFLCIINFGNETNSDSISDYAGLAKKRPFLTFAFSICLFNLAGLPIPPSGFIAKFILLKGAFDAGPLGMILGSIALLTTVISIFYYTYIAKIMICDEPSSSVLKIDENKNALGQSNELSSAIAFSVISIFVIFLYSAPILNLVNKTVSSLTPSCGIALSFKK